MHLCVILPNFKTMNKQMLINYAENWGSSLFIKCIHDSNQSVTSDQFKPLQSDIECNDSVTVLVTTKKQGQIKFSHVSIASVTCQSLRSHDLP